MGKYDALGKFGIGKDKDSDLFGLGEEGEDTDLFGLDEEDEDADSSDFSDEDEFDEEFDEDDEFDDEFEDEFDDEFEDEFEDEFGESPREYLRDHGYDDYDVDDLRSELRDYYGTAMFGGMPMAMMDVERVSGESDDDVIEEAHRMGFL